MPRPALSADRALQVIDVLVAHPTQRFTLTELSRRTAINPASAHALLAVMLRSGYVQRHPQHKTYTLGPALVAAGETALEQLPALGMARDRLSSLSDELQLEVVLTSPTDEEIIFVARAGRPSAFGLVLEVGQRVPLQPPLGSVFLAWSAEAKVARWLERAEPALTDEDVDHQRRTLAGVRERGYSIGLESSARQGFGLAMLEERDSIADLIAELGRVPYQLEVVEEQATYDVTMIAAPIFDANREVVAALTVVGFAPGLPASEIVRVGTTVRNAGVVITKRSQGKLPDAWAVDQVGVRSS
jgi:DNA-binding IclR family transcriptional regulator